LFLFSATPNHKKKIKKKKTHFVMLVIPWCDDFKEGVWYGYQTPPQMNLYMSNYARTHVFMKLFEAAME
jgi:hypothetical protein